MTAMPQGMFPHYHDNGEVDVWDKEGVKHRMLRANARDMVTHLGWFPGVPNVSRKEKAEKVVVLVSKTAAPAKDAKPEETEQVDLSTMDAPALAAFAKEHFGMDFGDAVSKEDILSAVLAEQG